MLRLLYVSPYALYDTVNHASGKINNYFIKEFKKNGNIDVQVAFVGFQKEKKWASLHKYGIECKEYYLSIFENACAKLISVVFYKFNPFCKYGYLSYPYYRKPLLKHLASFKQTGYEPDVIVLAWTQSMFLIDKVKDFFPNAKIVGTAEDVAFQASERLVLRSRGFRRIIYLQQYKREKDFELRCMGMADLVICNNLKDCELLKQSGISRNKLFTIVPYYSAYLDVIPNYQNRQMLYWGNLRRPENYLSVIWLIENVFRAIKRDFQDCELILAGADPNARLLKYIGNGIKITGFIKEPSTIFSEASILLAPLQLGAGIKIKVLEAMSAGLVVLTNSIGIEGIPATDGKHYFHCETAKEYIDTIRKVINDVDLQKEIGKNAKTLMRTQFALGESTQRYIDKVLGLI